MRTFVLAALIVAGSQAQASAQNPPADPWTKVPTTTSCFANDDFFERLDAASAQLNDEFSRQTAINANLKSKFDAMDGMEKAQRMQAFMMKNPQEAMKIMQAQQAVGATTLANVESADASMKRMEAELVADQASYKTAIDNAVKSVRARLKQLIDAKTVLIGHAAVPEFTAAADHAQYVALVNEDNAEHQRACAPYFGANGKFVKWLNTYRTEISEKLAGNQESDDAAIALQLAIMETTAGSYRSTGKVQAVRNYLFVVRRVYGIRQNRVAPSITIKK